MKLHMKQGWRLTIKHFYIIILLFLYELMWGFFLYRTIEGIVGAAARSGSRRHAIGKRGLSSS